MTAVASNHDTGAKALLNGAVAPAGLAMDADLANAMRNVFLNPNIGPFVSRQLIQKLVTGDPSPQYVARVAAVFNNNGQGMRGDMKAVVRAILLDPEARGAAKLDPAYGKLREPVLYVAAAARAVDSKSDGVVFGPAAALLGQNLFYPVSVFNYYPPDYVVPGTSLVGPEFALQNAATYINRDNVANVLRVRHHRAARDLPGGDGHAARLVGALGGRGQRDRADRQARRAAAARDHVAGDARRARGGHRRDGRPADACQDRVLPRHHVIRLPGAAMNIDRRHFLQRAGALSMLSVIPARIRAGAPATTRRWSACSCTAATTATTRSSRWTARDMRNTPPCARPRPACRSRRPRWRRSSR